MSETLVNVTETYLDKLEEQNLQLLKDKEDLVEALEKSRTDYNEYHSLAVGVMLPTGLCIRHTNNRRAAKDLLSRLQATDKEKTT